MDRAWIIGPWLTHAAASADAAGVDPLFVLVGDPRDPTVGVASHHAERTGRHLMIVHTHDTYWDELTSRPAERRPARVWNAQRHAHLATVRNRLLKVVRDLDPDVFLSLDSDILAHLDLVGNLLESLSTYAAVGGATFLAPAPSRRINCARTRDWHLIQDRPWRPGEVYPVDILMAIKAMSRSAYTAADYTGEANWGEDLAWSRNANAAGVTRGFDGRALSKHVMRRDQIAKIDPRLGW